MFNKSLNWKLVAIVLAVLFVGAVVYIAVGNYKAAKEAEKNEIFKQGAQFGYQSAVEQLMQNAAGCKPVDVFQGNVTMQLVDVLCLSDGSVK